MKHERKFREKEREYYERETRKKPKKGRRGELGIGELFAEGAGGDELQFSAPQPQAQPQQPQERKPFQFNEEHTIEVKGYKIDLSRVQSIEKTQAPHNGRISHGIAFSFMGKNGYGRTIWYGSNARQRDEEFDRYSAQWDAAQRAQGGQRR